MYSLEQRFLPLPFIECSDLIILLNQRFFFLNLSTIKTGTPRIRSQAFLPRKLITDPAVLKIELTIASIRPGSIPAIFFPSSLSPFPTPVATDLSPFVSELTITPITVPTAKNTAVTVNPYFLKIFLTFYLSESLSSSSSLSFSRAPICSNFSAIFFSCSFPY